MRSLSMVTSRAKMALKCGSSKHGKHDRASVAANYEKIGLIWQFSIIIIVQFTIVAAPNLLVPFSSIYGLEKKPSKD